MAPVLFTTPPLPTAHSFSITRRLPHGLVCFLSAAPEEPQWAPGPLLLLAWRKVHDNSGACYQASRGSWGGTYTQKQHSKHLTTGILVHCPIRMDATYKKQVQPHCWMPPCTPQPPCTPYPGSSGEGGFQSSLLSFWLPNSSIHYRAALGVSIPTSPSLTILRPA